MTTTRSGRAVKKPERYEPVEVPTDDYDQGDDESVVSSESESESYVDESESESESDEDADASGNLKGFVVSDDEDEDLD
jgi:hypothetical protein